MSKNIYKYFGPSNIDKVFALPDIVSLKCSYPKDFNDPYELFLTVDFDQRPDIIAFYADAIGDLPQKPTTCFSATPIVIPMWAHYAQNSEGFVIEFDEEKLRTAFSESHFDNVDYRDSSHKALTDMLYRASEIGKPRYVYLLQNWVFRAAYFTKTTCWSYEQERRMVANENEVRDMAGLLLLDVPKDCIRAIISGPRASNVIAKALQEKADELGCNYYQLKIGKSNASPYFIDESGSPFEFNGENIEQSMQSCETCREPISQQREFCSWCQIDESHREAAALRNPYRLYHHYGILESYIQSMDAISRKHRNK